MLMYVPYAFRRNTYTIIVFCLSSSTLLLGLQQKTIDTELCTLVVHAKQFKNKRVRFNARVKTAVIEGGVWLVDSSCIRKGVELSVPDYIRSHPEKYPDFKALDDAIRHQGNLGTVGKKISATFTGKFLVHSRRPKRSLVLEKVENLNVKSEQR